MVETLFMRNASYFAKDMEVATVAPLVANQFEHCSVALLGMSKPLEYLRLSPVRGQLEPYDPKSPTGWRYVQTTDTLNELKVCPFTSLDNTTVR
ncbi:hypothetical protein Ac2012v2_000729 [Leucoagaricus gongylophorus]